MGDLQRFIGGLDKIDLAADPAKALMDAVLQPAIGKHLHAHTNAEERPPALQHGLFQGVDHSGRIAEALVTIAEGADAGEERCDPRATPRPDRR